MFDSSKALNGSFGKLYHQGKHLTHVFGLTVDTDIAYEDIKRSGTRKTGNKATTIKTTGTITGYRVTNALANSIAQIRNDKKGAFITELHAQLSDPDNPDMGKMYRIKGVQFTKIPSINFEHGTLIEEEIPFVCDDVELMK